MRKAQPYFVSLDSRSAGFARLGLRVPKNNSKPVPQDPNQGKTNAAGLSTVFHCHFIFCQMPSQAALPMIQSP
jgi:hypothetical protein